VAIGSFDGVHVGHRAILAQARLRSRELGGRTVALTFHPHPSAVLTPDHPRRLLTTDDERRRLLFAAGVDEVVTLTFDRTLADLPAEMFVSGILVERLRPGVVVVGENFTFGRGAAGHASDLVRMGERYGFTVDILEPVRMDGTVVSSSRIRARIEDADFAGAARLLGAPYQIRGTVVRGHGEGQRLGFPTLNVLLAPEKCLPPEGVYAVWVELPDGQRRPGAADLGRRPTFETGGSLGLEVYLLEGGGDLYGATVGVEPVRYIRPDRAFPSADALRAAIAEDVQAVRRALGLGAK
jgi:riboflavin kinase/FMN adenylyltransferase